MEIDRKKFGEKYYNTSFNWIVIHRLVQKISIS